MPPVAIENPILNSPFREPTRHWEFSDEGITTNVVEGRRRSTYFIPIAKPKKTTLAGQLTLATPETWTAERMTENDFINRVRDQIAAFRRAGYPGVTPVTRELLEYWTDPERLKPLFFCQIEALETAVFLAEVAGRTQPWIENRLKEENQAKNAGLYRLAFKMATGSGKTVVMAMLIAWQALNKIANRQDRRFSDTFLVVAPGITIRDRLRVLLPNDPANYYQERDLVTPEQLARLQQANVLITNFHAFLRHDTLEAATLTKKVLVGPDGDPDQYKETPERMVRRVLGTLDRKRNIVVLNDEAHHCYQGAPAAEVVKMTADERAEAKRNDDAARVWLNGLRAVHGKVGIRQIYDLSATPFFLKGSGYPEGTLFPWVVSDFSLIDAIEAGIVKIPRVPVMDNADPGNPVFRELWPRIREWAPRKGRADVDLSGDPVLAKELEAALVSLYGNYRRSYEAWRQADVGTPPVFIVVCQNTSLSKVIFDWVAGYNRTLPSGETVAIPGHLEIFSNVERGAWRDRPNSLLIDSAQLESGEAMDPAFKKIAAAEIDEFKREYAIRNPGRSADELTDEDLLREVMNTIGKKDRLGEQVRCVVSVSMLTEGWDATTVTHILGVRAFGTQLLCEQVVGRGLRRISYEANAEGMFEPEYAEVYGVPFSFIPTVTVIRVPVQRPVHRVRALPERADLEMVFPHVAGYRYDLPTERLGAHFGPSSVMTLDTRQIPSWVELDPIVGETVVHNLDDLRGRRMQEVAFRIARRIIDDKFHDADGYTEGWLFPQLVPIVNRWLADYVVCKDATFPQLLLLAQWQHDAADRIYAAIVKDAPEGEKRLQPIMRPYDPMGSTRYVSFDTTKGVYTTERSHLNYLVLDSKWEAKLGEVLDGMDEVEAYVKNQGLNFKIPYTFEGQARNYLPDLLVRIRDSGGPPLTLIVEVTGEQKKEKAAKVAAARDLWVPAVNNSGGYGRWSFLEVTDPWDAASLIRAHIAELATQTTEAFA